MRVHDELPILSKDQDTVVTIGVFDGVHLGHQEVINQVKTIAESSKSLSSLITFTEHPRAVLSNNSDIKYITSSDRKVSLLKSSGLDLVIPLTFDIDLSKLRAGEFCQLLKDRLRMGKLVIGHDFVMGFQREGTPDVLRNIGNDLGFSVQIVDQVSERDTRISSTAIRKAIISSDVAEAARYLGRLFSLDGTVVEGDGKGRILGFPTANISINESRLVPGDGIYATWAYVDNKKYVSATSIGNKPTFDGISRLIEVYLLDFDGDIYGDTIEIEFSEHIRGQFKFENQEQLIAKMNEDIIKVRDIMSL